MNLYGIKIATFEGIRTLLGGPNKISCCFYFAWGRNSCSIDVLNEPTTPPTGRTFCWLTFLTSGLWILPEMDFPPFVLSTVQNFMGFVSPLASCLFFLMGSNDHRARQMVFLNECFFFFAPASFQTSDFFRVKSTGRSSLVSLVNLFHCIIVGQGYRDTTPPNG